MIEVDKIYLVEEKVSFNQYIMQKGIKLQFNYDGRGRLIGNRNDFRFLADVSQVEGMIKTNKLKIQNE